MLMIHSALLQHSCSRSLPISLTSTSPCRSVTRIVDSLVLTLRLASLISSTYSRYSALEFGSYSCINYRERPNSFKLNMHTVHPSAAVPKLFLIAYYLWALIFAAYHLENTLFQKNSFSAISFDQKFGKPDLTQMRHEQNGCEKL